MGVQQITTKKIVQKLIRKIKKNSVNSIVKKDIDLYYEIEDRKLIYKNIGF